MPCSHFLTVVRRLCKNNPVAGAWYCRVRSENKVWWKPLGEVSVIAGGGHRRFVGLHIHGGSMENWSGSLDGELDQGSLAHTHTHTNTSTHTHTHTEPRALGPPQQKPRSLLRSFPPNPSSRAQQQSSQHRLRP